MRIAGIFVRGTLAAVGLVALASACSRGSIATAASPAAGSQLAIVAAVIHNPSHVEVTSVTVGTKVHVRATIAGAFGTPTGTVTSRVYSNGSCSGFIEGESSAATLSGGAVDITGFTWTSNTAGQASFIVHYNGNATYAARDGFCTAVTFTKILPTVTLRVHDPSHATVVEVPLGVRVHPWVGVTGSLGVPTGTAMESFWKNGNCFGSPQITFAAQSLVGGALDASGLVEPSTVLGSYSWRASYQGNATYQARTSACVEYVVVKATPTVSLSLHDPNHEPTAEVAVGTKVHPAVRLSGPVGTPTGTVQVKRYAGTTCFDLQSTTTASAQATIDPAETPFSYDVPGSWSWKISYLGDDQYTPVDSACMKVHWKAQPHIDGFIHDASHDLVSTVAPGTAVHLDVVTQSTFGLPTPTGKVAVYFYSNGNCPGSGGVNQGTGALSSGALDASAFGVAPTTPGTYQMVPVYQGDSSYYITVGPCVVFHVAIPATPKPTPAPTKPPTPAPSVAPTPTGQATTTPTIAPSLAPGATPTVAPSAVASPEVTLAPGASPTPEPSGAAGSPGEGSSAAPGSSGAGPSAAGSPGPSGGPTTPAGDSGSALPGILLLLAAVLVVVAIGVYVGSRRRRAS
ncbi:MAG TPA: hypothetical protein VF484_11425 [Candidatus Limnocylindrales bacterium]